MLKKIFYFLFLSFVCSSVYGQNQFNDWVKPNQVYVEFKVWEDGIYRINREDLKAINNNFITINPKNLQVFCRGEEQYIYVHGENDFSFDANDYIELYCRKNDGFLDIPMYRDASEQNNPYYSQVNDTISYFITWENSPTPKKRYNNYSSDNYQSYNPLNSVEVEDLYSYTGAFYWGQRLSPYSSGKGWFDNQVFTQNTHIQKVLQLNHKKDGTDVSVEYSVCGVPASNVISNTFHQVQIRQAGILKEQIQYEGYEGYVGNFNVPNEEIYGNKINLIFSSLTVDIDLDKSALAYIILRYQRDLNFSGENECRFFYNSTSNQQINFQEFSGNNLVLYNLTKGERTSLISNSSNWSGVLNASNEKSEIVVRASDAVRLVKNGKEVHFQEYADLEVNPDYLIVYPKVLESAVTTYKSYRESKGYNVLMAEISDLYRHFSYGIEKHPMAISNFVKYIQTKYGNPKYLFLIGKGVSTADLRKGGIAFSRCMVPTMGNPPSDNMFTMDISSDNPIPQVFTGRISATSNEEVLGYLEKVKDYESANYDLTRKRAIHFSGGSNVNEQTSFKQYLKSYENIYKDTLIGGVVSTFYKNSSDPMQTSLLDSVDYLINNGVDLINFFGHGSASGFDQNIDEPENYQNKGKYPLIYANSCLSGNIHRNLPNKSISERWVLEPNKGAIGFLASVDLGFPYYLHVYATQLYKAMAYRAFSLPIGDAIHNAITHCLDIEGNNSYMQKTIYDNTLHADPAIPLHDFFQPDLELKSSYLTFSQQPITTKLDSFSINFEYFNLGRAVADTFLISVERILPDGSSTLYTILQSGIKYSNVASLKIPTDMINGVGMNKLNIRLDHLNSIEENNEMNNDIELTFWVQSSGVSPIYPYEFQVVPNIKPTLVAGTGNPFEEDFVAVFQIDTTDHFNSPLFNTQEIETNGGFTEWTLPFNLTDSTVYFWRVAKKGSDRWQNSSFRYIKDQTGWSQAHHYQYEKDNFKFIKYEKEIRDLSYVNSPKTLLARTIGSPSLASFSEIGFWLDGSGDINSCSAAPAFNVVVIDSVNLEPLLSSFNNYGHRNYPKCPSRSRPDKYFQFTTTNPVEMSAMADMLNAQPDGSYILIYTIVDGNFLNLSEDILSAFEQLNPNSQIRNLSNNIPFIMYAQKGQPSSAQEVYGQTITDDINLSVNLKTVFDYGHIYSSIIGPAREWGSFHWRYKDDISKKRTDISILGIDNLGQETELISGINQDELNVYNLSESIDANQYPYLKLHLFTKDSISKIPTQLKSWSVLYSGVPETVIDPDLPYVFKKDTLEKGEELVFAISTKNVSPYDMDSLLVKYFIYDNQNNINLIKSKKLRPHPSQDVITDSVHFNTIHSEGLNSIMVEFNAENGQGVYDQLEQTHYNNVAFKNFFVKKDKINPVLNVTFDGVHIMDGDIVSASPEILIKINDENRYLAMDNPDLVSVYLSREGDAEEQRIEMYDSLSNQQLFWTASTLPDNVAQMKYVPQKLEDGIYTLRVGVTDASLNESGKNHYKITFEVINKSSITQVLNYPNPFSTATHFVFTLTGSEVPDEIIVQIMTVNGKIVKEINLSEVATITIGRNITDYAWDGKDKFGDLLANGVYFYRVIIRNQGNEIEKRESDIDKFFKNGIGKMYLLR